MKLLTLSLLFLWLVTSECASVISKISNASNQLSSESTLFVGSWLPQSCSQSPNRWSGVQRIDPQPGFGEPVEVFCDQSYDGGGWTVIQQRFNGTVYFYRGWQEYEAGFGAMGDEFWLGLRKIHQLTYSRPYELHVVLEDWEGNSAVAKYSRFLVSGPEEKYRLNSLGKYSGNAGDGLGNGLGMMFSTLDSGNDKTNDGHYCVQTYKGAWWYNSCHSGNLNGLYTRGNGSEYASVMCWAPFRGYYYGLKTSRMLIRATA